MLSPNILITNYCNQNCSFCFAATEMADKTIDREMELENFELILKQMKKTGNGKEIVKLLGGEPTLHSQFDKIIQISLKYFPFVQIFTNGLLNKKKVEFLQHYFPRIKFTFNVMTPGFILKKNIRENILKTIDDFSKNTEITLSLTIDPYTEVLKTLNNLPKETICSVSSFRIGFSNPVAGIKNYYSFEDFPNMGQQLFTLIQYIKDCGSTASLNLNCGFTRCMFTNQQFKFIRENKIKISGWGCFGKTSSMDINPNLAAFHCFPLSTKYRTQVNRSNYDKITSQLLKKRYEYWKKIYFSVCKKCPFYGHTLDKCPGPCIAFRLNNIP